jgi:predicted esterase
VLGVSIDYTLNAGFAPASSDVRDALAWLKSLPDVVPSRVALLGHSAGAALVAAAAYQDGARALVLAAPGSSAASPVSKYGGADDPETLVIHGTSDELVPPDEIRQVIDALTTAGVAHHYRLVKLLGHFGAVQEQAEPITAWLVPRLRV